MKAAPGCELYGYDFSVNSVRVLIGVQTYRV